MAATLAWWRKIGMALAALVLAMIVLGPSVDRMICGDDVGMGAAASERVVATASPDHDSDGEPCGDLSCLHGHCHHGSPSVSLAASDAVERHDMGASVHPLRRGRVATSDPKFDLMRPPRA